MTQKPRKPTTPARVAGNIDGVLAAITAMISSRLMVLANLLKRGAILRYKRLAGLSSVEFGLVASLGRRPPMSVIRLAEAVGMERGRSAAHWRNWSGASWSPRKSIRVTIARRWSV